MFRKGLITILAVVMLFVVCPASRADIITIGIEGVVDSIGDPYNLLENKIHQGDSTTGFYIYDSETPDSTPELTWNGLYEHTTAPYGMSLTIGEIIFQTDTADVDFMVNIWNNFNETEDCYRITSYNNLMIGDLLISRLDWILEDYSGNALSSIELPDTPPDLLAWQSNLLIVDGFVDDEYFRIDGHITDVWLIPEPATILLITLGGLLLRRPHN